MTPITAVAIATLSLLTPSTPVQAQEPPRATELANEQLQPSQVTWEGVELGREAEGKCTMTVSGDSIHFQGANKKELYKGTFSLPPRTSPQQLCREKVVQSRTFWQIFIGNLRYSKGRSSY